MIIEFAGERTLDPLPEVMEKLFGKCEILISNQVLEVLKKMHSYTAINNEYTFHRRARGTDILFSFRVKEGTEGNFVSDLECIGAEVGLAPRVHKMHYIKGAEKVYFMFQGEEKK